MPPGGAVERLERSGWSGSFGRFDEPDCSIPICIAVERFDRDRGIQLRRAGSEPGGIGSRKLEFACFQLVQQLCFPGLVECGTKEDERRFRRFDRKRRPEGSARRQHQQPGRLPFPPPHAAALVVQPQDVAVRGAQDAGRGDGERAVAVADRDDQEFRFISELIRDEARRILRQCGAGREERTARQRGGDGECGQIFEKFHGFHAFRIAKTTLY